MNQNHTTQEPLPGATVAILDGRSGPQVGTYLGRDVMGRAHVRRALGGTWAGDAKQVIA